MADIKIPSSNIYSIERGDVENKIEQVSVSASEFVASFGDVLDKEYNIIYWEIDASKRTALYKGSDPDINEFVSKKVSVTEIAQYDLAVYGFDCTFTIDKYARFKVIDDKPITTVVENECYVVRKQKYETYDGNLEKTSEREITIKHGTGIKYNKVKNAFEYSLDTTEMVGGEGSIWGTVVATYYGEGGVEYLVSETITVESKYVTPEAVEVIEGSSSYNEFSLPSNELVQSGSLYYNPPDSFEIIKDEMLPNIAEKYKNGHEVWTIKCSISDYYDTNGNLVICPKDATLPAAFKLHQWVVPYMFTSKGETPIGIKADGTPMVFEIIGIDYSYSGVVWQTLTLEQLWLWKLSE